jgi:parallel beta-helix repeat protein
LAIYQRLCEGKRLAGEGKHAEALSIFNEIVGAEAGSSYGWDADIQAAHSMGYLGQHKEALARCDRIINDCPLEDEIPKTQLVKADIYSLAGQHDVAIKLLEKIIVENTDVNSLVCEEALVEMTIVYTRTGQFGLVRAVMERIAADYPGDEARRRKWAISKVDFIRKEASKLQKPRIEELLARKGFQKVEKLDGGPITWTAENGPYLVTQPLVIGSDDTLRIESGTQVRFGVLGELQIKGRLEVLGTAEKPVELLPLGDDTTIDSWMGLELTAGKNSGASKLTHCRLVGANIGLNASRGLIELDRCVFDRCGRAGILASRGVGLAVTNCKIVNCYRVGVECESKAVLHMADCQINGLTTYGVKLKEVSDKSSLTRTLIEHCGWDGVFVRGRCSPTIEACQILNNKGSGVRALDGASPTVLNTRIQNNGGAGIQLKERWAAVLRGNTIVSNGNGGVVAEVRCNGEIVGNRLENNGQVGLLLRMDCAPSITNNRFIKNQGPGLLLQNSQPKKLRDNQFISNTGAALRNEGIGSVQAAHNWWNTTSEKEIAQLIQDRRSNPQWGEVNFTPWLSEAPTLSKDNPDGH